MTYTATSLARTCGLSRSTVLYYESINLLNCGGRTAGNYRVYSDQQLARLRRICAYREAGLGLSDIKSMLDGSPHEAIGVLHRRFFEINSEIARLREHQRLIARLLETANNYRRLRMLTKEMWIDVMKAANFSPEDMHRWHVEFEKAAPAEHQEFLEFLHIPKDEIDRIRAECRGV